MQFPHSEGGPAQDSSTFRYTVYKPTKMRQMQITDAIRREPFDSSIAAHV